jgi:hypothetical protein
MREHLKTRKAGHLYIQKDQVGLELIDESDGIYAVVGFAQHNPLGVGGYVLFDELAACGLIVGNDYFFR